MPNVKSLEDLKKIRDEALKKRDIKTPGARVQIVVGMGTPGIAAGARDTLKEFLESCPEAPTTSAKNDTTAFVLITKPFLGSFYSPK